MNYMSQRLFDLELELDKFDLEQNIKLEDIVDLKQNKLSFKCALPKTLQAKIHELLKNNNQGELALDYNVTAKQLTNNVKRHKNIKNVIAIGAGKGGVGKSSVALNTAKALAKTGVQVGILDLDLYGPNIPRMLGVNSPETSMPQHDLTPEFIENLAVISLAQVVANADPILWRGPMAGKVVEQLFWSANWPDLDYLIIDLPPGTGDVLIALTQKLPITSALLVTTPQAIACLDAQKALTMFTKLNIPVLGFVNNMAYYECQNCASKQDIFIGANAESIAKELDLPCLQELPLALALARSNESNTELPATWQKYFADLALHIALKINTFKRDRSLLLPQVSVINKEN